MGHGQLVSFDHWSSASANAVYRCFNVLLFAGERHSFTANTIIRNPGWRKSTRTSRCAFRRPPPRALASSMRGQARLTTKRASAIVAIDEAMAAGHVARLNGLGLDHLEGEQRLRNPVGRRSSRGAKIAIPGSAGRGARARRRASKRLRPRRNAARGRSRADLDKESVRAAITGWGNIPSLRTEKAGRKSTGRDKTEEPSIAASPLDGRSVRP